MIILPLVNVLELLWQRITENMLILYLLSWVTFYILKMWLLDKQCVSVWVHKLISFEFFALGSNIKQPNFCFFLFDFNIFFLRWSFHLAHIDHCSPLEFPVAHVLEHPTDVLTVMGLNPICELTIFFWVLLSPHILSISIEGASA